MKFRSIYSKLILIIAVIALLTVGFFEIAIYISNHNSYYRSVNEFISNKARASAEYYKAVPTSGDKRIDASNIIFAFTDERIRIQVTDAAGNVIADSGTSTTYLLDNEDVKKALTGIESKLIYKDNLSGNKIYAFSVPLIRNTEIEGSVRVSTLLDGIDAELRRLTFIYALIGLGIFLFAVIVGVLLSRTIVGPIRSVAVAASALGSGDLSIRAKVKAQDETGQLAEAFNNMADDLERMDQMKNKFISQISHELRSPLTNIKGWASTVKQSDPAEHSIIERGLDVILSETDRLTEMVEELLSFSHIQAGQFKLNKIKVDLSAICEKVNEMMLPRSQRQGVVLRCDANPGVYALADANRIKQILINLLDNSLKFTDYGGNIAIKCSEIYGYAIITIEDTGSGIPADILPRVKELFFRGDDKGRGAGLGLAICDRLVKLHNGSLDIQSEAGKGTIVTITLPVEN